MPFDPQTHQAEALRHFVRLASEPAWRQYVWHQANQMARDCPELYRDLPAQLTAAMRQTPALQADASAARSA